MWDKDNMKEMDEEKKAKWTKKLIELGVPEEKIDEPLIWSFKKVSFKLGRLRLALDEKGVEESKAKEPDQRIGNRGVGHRREVGEKRITRAAPTQSQGIEIQAPDIGRRDRSKAGAPHQSGNV